MVPRARVGGASATPFYLRRTDKVFDLAASMVETAVLIHSEFVSGGTIAEHYEQVKVVG